MQFLEFAFQGPFHFLGVLILTCAVLNGVFRIACAITGYQPPPAMTDDE
jgi:hypothetical protein